MSKDQIDQLKNPFTMDLNRRQFVTSSLAAGIILPTALAAAGNASAGSHKAGGKFRLGMGHGSTTDSLDPGRYYLADCIGCSWKRFSWISQGRW